MLYYNTSIITLYCSVNTIFDRFWLIIVVINAYSYENMLIWRDILESAKKDTEEWILLRKSVVVTPL